MGKRRLGAVVAAAVAVLVGGPAAAQAPDHPVITEVYQEPPSLGGPGSRSRNRSTAAGAPGGPWGTELLWSRRRA